MCVCVWGEVEGCGVWDVQRDGVSGSQRRGGSVSAASTCTAHSRTLLG